MSLPVLQLRPREEKRLRVGHLWVYSNEIDTQATPLHGLEPGSVARLTDAQGKLLAVGYVNPHSLIAFRILSRDPHTRIDQGFFEHRLAAALALRNQRFSEPFYRLVHGEGDGLPGLIVDRFGAHWVLQFNTAGMQAQQDVLIAALRAIVPAESIVLRNDSGAREQEGLLREVVVAYGAPPAQVEIEENGARFHMPLLQGQKTGWFYDHRLNREALLHYVHGARVLDGFSYLGAWGIPAALAGAASVLCIDGSAEALRGVEQNAVLNGVEDRVSTQAGNAFELFKQLVDAGEYFDVVIVDPPAFIKSKKDEAAGREAYRRIFRLAMQLLVPGGLLSASSCSHHLSASELERLLLDDARKLGREIALLERGGQGPDHPIHLAIPETAYLKSALVRVS